MTNVRWETLSSHGNITGRADFRPHGTSQLIAQFTPNAFGKFTQAGHHLGMLICHVGLFAGIGFHIEEGQVRVGDLVAVAAGDPVDAGLSDRCGFQVFEVGGLAVATRWTGGSQVVVSEMQLPFATANGLQLVTGVEAQRIVG